MPTYSDYKSKKYYFLIWWYIMHILLFSLLTFFSDKNTALQVYNLQCSCCFLHIIIAVVNNLLNYPALPGEKILIFQLLWVYTLRKQCLFKWKFYYILMYSHPTGVVREIRSWLCEQHIIEKAIYLR